jgi:hypothetical protein
MRIPSWARRNNSSSRLTENDEAPKSTSVLQDRILHNLGPVIPARAFWRRGDDGVDRGGVELAVDCQPLRRRLTLTHILFDQRFGSAAPKWRNVSVGSRFNVVNKPATEAHSGVNPFTKEPMEFAASKPSRRHRRRPAKDAV